MFRALKRRALPALALFAAISVAMAAANSTVAMAGADSTSYWGTESTIATLEGDVLLTSADCTSTSTCVVAGGPLSNGLPVVSAESDGNWGDSAIVPLTGGPSAASYDSISCMSASSCFGVGFSTTTGTAPIAGSVTVSGSAVTAGLASTLTLPSSPASHSPEEAVLESVSCSATSCAAVGWYETSSGSKDEPLLATTSGNGLWSTTTVAPPALATEGAILTAVACPSSGPCEAGGTYENSSSDLVNWVVQLGGGTPQSVTPPPDAVPSTEALPAGPSPVVGLGSNQSITSISCPSASVCTAVGAYPSAGGDGQASAVSIADGSPATAIAMPSSGAGASVATSVYCSDASDCVAAADIIDSAASPETFTPVTTYETGGVWSPLATLPGGQASGSSETLAIGLGCSALNRCLIDGLEISVASSTVVPMVDFSAPPLSVSTFSLPAATVGQPYSTTLQSSGGAGPGTWAINNGSLPAGLSLNPSTGVISGTPTTAGTDGFTVQLASAGPPSQTASTNLSITVGAAPVAAPPAPPAAPAAAPKLSFGSVKVTPSGVTLALGCAGSGTCSGKAVVTAVEHLTGKRITAVTARAKKRKVTITLARGSYSLTAGQLGTINLKLTAQAKALLRKLHTIKGRLTLTPTGASKPTLTRTVTFKSAKKK